MAINSPYVPGDPRSYDLKWIVAKIKQLLSSVTSLTTAVGTAQNRADDAYDLADNANNAAIAAQGRADDAYTLADSGVTPILVPRADLIDSDNTTANIIDLFAYRIGKLLFFRIYLGNIGSGTRAIYFKAPYNNFISVVQWPLVTEPDPTDPYFTNFERMILPDGDGPAHIVFGNVTTSTLGYYGGIVILNS